MAQGGLRVPSLLAMPEAHQHITHRDARRPSEGGRRRPVMLTRASPEVPGQCWDPTPYYGASSMTGPRGSTPACWRQVGALAAEAWSGWGASGGGTGQGNRVQRDRLVGAMPSRCSVTPPAPPGSTGGYLAYKPGKASSRRVGLGRPTRRNTGVFHGDLRGDRTLSTGQPGV